MALAAALAACAAPSPAPSSGPGALRGGLVVFAAASLTESFNALTAEFMAQHPAIRITTSYTGSSAAVADLINGADADVYASADEPNMQKLVDAKLAAGDAVIFALNSLQIVVRAGNPKGIAQLADLSRPDLFVVLAAPAVPVGAYGQQAFDRAGVRITPKSLETDVKQVIAKVSLGEADAGVVYSTDVRAAGSKVQGVEIPDRFNVVARYPIAIVKGTKNEAAAAAFVAFVRSARGREILTSFGFTVP